MSPSLYGMAAIDAERAVTRGLRGSRATDPVSSDDPRSARAPAVLRALRGLIGTAFVRTGEAIRGADAQPRGAC